MAEEFLSEVNELGRLMDDVDVLKNYDQMMVDLIGVPRPDFFGRRYTKEELLLWNIQELRKLAKERNLHSETDRSEILIKAILNYQRIPVVFATAEPAYATQELATGRKEGTPVYTIRYPIASLQRLPPTVDNDLFNLAPRRKIVWTADGNAVMQGQQPNPLVIPYQLDFITTKRAHMNIIDMFMDRFFGKPYVRTVVNIGDPWGERAAYILQEGTYVEDTDLEPPAEKAEKLIRHSYTMIVHGWMPVVHWVTPTVRKFTKEYINSRHTEEVLLENTEVLEDIYKDS